jgi:glycine zipper 2TM protein
MFRPLATVFAFMAAAAFADPAVAPPTDAAIDAESPATAISEIYVYASKGQTDKQLDRDRYECHNWAVAQSHYNPSDPHLAPHQQIQVVAAPPPGRNAVMGAIAGAVTGAIIAGPHDSDRGAVIGAVAGGAMEAERINGQSSADAQAERARLETQASNYRRAISACLEGRGYTVK